MDSMLTSPQRAADGQKSPLRVPTRSDTEWMDRERALERILFPKTARVAPDPLLRVMRRRRSYLGHRDAVVREQGRVPRVCLYVLAVHVEQVPVRSLEAVRGFAVREGWGVGVRQVFTDKTGLSFPGARPGWSHVQEHVRSGYADGVVVLTQSAITPRLDEYERQVRWFEDHFGFIALVHPEFPLDRP